ncbi:MAG: FAD-dependent oxidoreductase [Treponema sp.]|nr:FAD-dependent oxidoreductase [Treponema sp.]
MEKNNYNVIIIGAGISGCICALELEKKHKILFLDAGKSIKQRKCSWEKTNTCIECKPCNLITGIGGCIKPGDSAKLSFPPSGKRLLSINKECDNIAKLLNKKYFYHSVANSTIESFKDFILRKYPISIIDSNASERILKNLEKKIQSRKNIILKYQEEVLDIDITKIFTVRTNKEIYTANRVILATGRYGRNWLKSFILRNDIQYKKSQCLVGLRFQLPYEVLITPGKLHPDFKYTKTFNSEDKVKTFCFCGGESGGIIKPLFYDGIQLLDGHINTVKKSSKGNFALLHTVTEEEVETIISRYKEESNGKIIIEQYSDFNKDTSKFSKILSGKIKNNIHKVYEELFNAFNENNEYSINDTEVFGIEIENNWYEISTNNKFEVTSIPGLYVVGDALAIAQGLMQAAITGYITAHGINNS